MSRRRTNSFFPAELALEQPIVRNRPSPGTLADTEAKVRRRMLELAMGLEGVDDITPEEQQAAKAMALATYLLGGRAPETVEDWIRVMVRFAEGVNLQGLEIVNEPPRSRGTPTRQEQRYRAVDALLRSSTMSKEKAFVLAAQALNENVLTVRRAYYATAKRIAEQRESDLKWLNYIPKDAQTGAYVFRRRKVAHTN